MINEQVGVRRLATGGLHVFYRSNSTRCCTISFISMVLWSFSNSVQDVGLGIIGTSSTDRLNEPLCIFQRLGSKGQPHGSGGIFKMKKLNS